MEQSTEILVVILSVTLTIFLFVGIALLITLIKFISYLRVIALKAEQVVDNVESASEILKNAAGPMAVGRFLVNVIDLIIKKNRG